MPRCVCLCVRWNCIVTTHGPPPMAGHSSSVINNMMVVFGGSLGARQMYVPFPHVFLPTRLQFWSRKPVISMFPPVLLRHDHVCFRSNEVWVLDLEQWSWSKPIITGSAPHPRGGQSQVSLSLPLMLPRNFPPTCSSP